MVVVTAADGARFEAYLHGAHVTSWRAAGDDEERLFVSAAAKFEDGLAIRGGIPVCFPQFADQGPLPMHGLVRTVPWVLLARAARRRTARRTRAFASRRRRARGVAAPVRVRARRARARAPADGRAHRDQHGAGVVRVHGSAAHLSSMDRRARGSRARAVRRALSRQGVAAGRRRRACRRADRRSAARPRLPARPRGAGGQPTARGPSPYARPARPTPSCGIRARSLRSRPISTPANGAISSVSKLRSRARRCRSRRVRVDGDPDLDALL